MFSEFINKYIRVEAEGKNKERTEGEKEERKEGERKGREEKR